MAIRIFFHRRRPQLFLEMVRRFAPVMKKRCDSCQCLEQGKIWPTALPLLMQDILTRCIDGNHALCIEFITVSHYPEKLAAIARANPTAGHRCAFCRTPAQELPDLLYAFLCHNGLPCIISDAVCKLIQDAANRQQGFLVNCRIGSSEKQGQSHEGFDHHATVPVAL